MTKPRRMDGYIRVSRRMKREGPGYISPDVQREAIQRWADYRGVEIVAWHVDEDESGGTQDRPGMREFMRRMEAGETDGIAVWKFDRFARNVHEAIADVKAMEARGKHLAAVTEDIDPTGPFGSFILTIMLAVATLQRDNLVSGWKVAKTRAVERGAPIGPTHFGYRRTAGGTLEPDPETAPIVREAFIRAARDGHSETIRYLESAAPNKRWTTTTLRRLIGNRTYLGEVRWDGIVKHEAHEPLTDRVTWERAQLAPAVRRASAVAYPLSGLAVCDACGEILVGARGGPDNRRMYRCRAGLKTWRREPCGAPAGVTAEHLEAFVLDAVVAAYDAAERGRELGVRDAGADDDGALVRAESELLAAESELDRFAADPVAAETLGEVGWQAALQARAERVTAAREALVQESEKTREARVEIPAAMLRTLGPQDLGEVLRAAVRELRLRKGRGHLGDRVVIRLHDADDRARVSTSKDVG